MEFSNFKRRCDTQKSRACGTEDRLWGVLFISWFGTLDVDLQSFVQRICLFKTALSGCLGLFPQTNRLRTNLLGLGGCQIAHPIAIFSFVFNVEIQ
jgi:hypothetical protein